MHTSIPTPTLAMGSGETVASYRDARGAALAVAELTDHGFPEDAVTVRPAGLSMKPSCCGPRTDRLRASILGGILGCTATVITTFAVIDSAILSVLVAVVGGVCAAGIASSVAAALAVRRNRRQDEEATTVRADRFDVVVDERAREANHLLARWWEPEARPTSVNPRSALERP